MRDPRRRRRERPTWRVLAQILGRQPRLDQEPDGAGAARQDLVVSVVVVGDEQDSGARACALKRSGHLEPVVIAQVHIQPHGIGLEAGRCRDRRFSAHGLPNDRIAAVRQQLARRGPEPRMIVDDEHTAGHA